MGFLKSKTLFVPDRARLWSRVLKYSASSLSILLTSIMVAVCSVAAWLNLSDTRGEEQLSSEVLLLALSRLRSYPQGLSAAWVCYAQVVLRRHRFQKASEWSGSPSRLSRPASRDEEVEPRRLKGVVVQCFAPTQSAKGHCLLPCWLLIL